MAFTLLLRAAMVRLALALLSTSLVVAAIGCTPVQYTPPARTIAFDSPVTPPTGHVDVQADVAAAGAIFGPNFSMGDGRARVAVSDQVVIEGEAGVLHESDANEGANPSATAYTGRAGVMIRTPPNAEGTFRAAFLAGVGGGTSATAGDWAAADVGGAVATKGRFFRAFAGLDLTYSAPIDARSFAISDGSDSYMLTLQQTATLRGTLGVEIGPPQSAVIIGMAFIAPSYVGPGGPPSSVDTSDGNNGNVAFMQLGIGFRLQPDAHPDSAR